MRRLTRIARPPWDVSKYAGNYRQPQPVAGDEYRDRARLAPATSPARRRNCPSATTAPLPTAAAQVQECATTTVFAGPAPLPARPADVADTVGVPGRSIVFATV